ncbi:stonustoxin subunit beta-like protein [Labeo rohita]|uniref:Stonustoxin subunit beta-like protein n=1 Tax=Labeo rohita TaxID=84645 RepID=A0A498NZV3_LABRO|nr:stonustoxin subunit beta-like protein [Labeo rohita]
MLTPRQPSPRLLTPRQPSPRLLTPRQPSPRLLTPRQPSPRLLTPRQPSPRLLTPRQPSPRLLTPRQPSPRLLTPRQPSPRLLTPRQPSPRLLTPRQPSPRLLTPRQPSPRLLTPRQPSPRLLTPRQPSPRLLTPRQPSPRLLTPRQPSPRLLTPQMKNSPGSCILFYENRAEEATCFTPPLKPACPVIEQISGHSVVVKVSPACPATEELRLLYKMKEEEKDWKFQSVQSQDTVTLTDLSPDTEYEMKYTAVGKLNYTVDSDVIHLRVIDKKLIDATESVLETLNLIENKCSELMQDNSAVTFSAVHRKIRDMMRYCQTYKQDLSNRIKSVIQSIQTCEKDISALIDLLQAHNESPFNKSYLTDWITVKEKESNSVNKFLQQLCDSGAEVNNNLDTFLSDIEVKNLVCYTFSSLDLPDDLLSDQENFLKPSVMMRNSEKKPKAVPQTWLTGSVREKMRERLEIFKELMLLHGDQSTTFLVTSKEHTIHPGSCILLYVNGSDDAICFTPPLKPACPVIEKISGHSVVVKVSPACPATEELRLLYKMKEEKDWKSQSVQNHDTVTPTDLSPDTEYEMKYTAVGKLNYTVDSDVTRVTTRSTNIRAV